VSSPTSLNIYRAAGSCHWQWDFRSAEFPPPACTYPFNQMTAPSPQPWQRFLAGTVSGAALTAVGHPFDTVRVKLQTTSSSSLLSVLRELWRAEGLRGFYRGFSPPFALTGLVNTILWGTQFTITDAMKSADIGGGNTSRAILAAVPASFVSAFVVAPMELLKTRQQTSPSRQSLPAVLEGIVRAEGVGGLYRGFSIVCLARLLGGWGYFGGNSAALEALNERFPAAGAAQAARNTLLAGGFAGICYWCLAMPVDTVKSTVMSSGAARTGTAATIRLLYSKGGLARFYKGFSAAILRAFPANASAFLAFDLTMQALQRERRGGGGDNEV
jgi:hypothetical protein